MPGTVAQDGGVRDAELLRQKRREGDAKRVAYLRNHGRPSRPGIRLEQAEVL